LTSSIKKVVLLSAGFGARLKPVTDMVPKCLVPISGKPLLQYWLESLSRAGIEEFLINSHYLAEQVKLFVDSSPLKEQITLTYEPVLLGTLGSLAANQDFWHGEPVLVVHADNLCLVNWFEFFEAFNNRPDNCIGTMMLFESDNPSSCGIVQLDKQKRVIAFHEKVASPPSNLANGAVYLFDHHLANAISSLSVKCGDISLDLMPTLLGKLNSWKADGYFRDIGTPESLALAQDYIRRGI